MHQLLTNGVSLVVGRLRAKGAKPEVHIHGALGGVRGAEVSINISCKPPVRAYSLF
jgi:hypothetical protein